MLNKWFQSFAIRFNDEIPYRIKNKRGRENFSALNEYVIQARRYGFFWLTIKQYKKAWNILEETHPSYSLELAEAVIEKLKINNY